MKNKWRKACCCLCVLSHTTKTYTHVWRVHTIMICVVYALYLATKIHKVFVD